jgi:hypothetical protein
MSASTSGSASPSRSGVFAPLTALPVPARAETSAVSALGITSPDEGTGRARRELSVIDETGAGSWTREEREDVEDAGDGTDFRSVREQDLADDGDVKQGVLPEKEGESEVGIGELRTVSAGSGEAPVMGDAVSLHSGAAGAADNAEEGREADPEEEVAERTLTIG